MSCINQSNGTPCRTNRNSGSNTRTTNCVAEVVAFINELQNAVIDPCCLTNCLNPVLGERQEALQANTRPFILFGNDGKPFTAYYRQNPADVADQKQTIVMNVMVKKSNAYVLPLFSV